jgi:uncharacterized protein (DUF488 family)
VVDVRRYPGSKVCPQFNKEEMSKELKNKNIEYINIEKLGGRRKKIVTENSRCDYNSGWKNNSFRAYADYMTTSYLYGFANMVSIPFSSSVSCILIHILPVDSSTAVHFP